MEIFQNVKLGEIISVKGGKRLPAGCNLSKEVTKHPYIRARDIGNGQITFDDPVYLDETTFLRIKNYIVNKGDVCITIVGANVGDVGFVPDFLDGGNLTENAVRLFPKKNNFNKKFLGYCLLTDDIKLQMKQLAGGAAAQPKLGLYKIKELEIPSPSIEIQHRVVSTLSAYTDLIENNEKRIKILESMAQKLYSEWFVKFKFPGHEKMKMVDSGHPDFGMIPDRWSMRTVGETAQFLNGYPFKPSQLGEIGLPIVKIPELRSGILEKTPRNTGDDIPERYLLKNGDILFSWSATLLVNIWNSGTALLNQHLFKVTPREKYLYSFVYIMLQNQIEKYRGYAVGATMQHLRRDVVEGAFIVVPDESILVSFEDVTSKILLEKSLLERSNHNLRKSRDHLIPQLVSGKIEIK